MKKQPDTEFGQNPRIRPKIWPDTGVYAYYYDCVFCVAYVQLSYFCNLFKVRRVTGAVIVTYSRPLLWASYEVTFFKHKVTAKMISPLGDRTQDLQVVSH